MNRPIADPEKDPTAGLQCYQVGGAVRDALLGLPVQDRDWVVVGTTPDEMSARGFTPVGRDFPVFLHPVTHEEYALARTERKSGQGYRGFVVHCAPDVSLEEDLLRRDLTVNAMALDAKGRLIDPQGGQQDLAQGLLRHVSPAFIEDPVRILRVARFCARFGQFRIAPETLELMRTMVERGEVDALVPERIWQELARGLMYPHAARMLDALKACGALARMLPALDHAWPAPGVCAALAQAVAIDAPLPVRWAALLHQLGMDEAGMVQSAVRAPQACADLARMLIREQGSLQSPDHDSQSALSLLEHCDALRKPERFEQLLQAMACVRRDMEPLLQGWRRALDASRAVQAGAIAQAVPPEPALTRAERIRAAVAAARCAAITTASGVESEPGRKGLGSD